MCYQQVTVQWGFYSIYHLLGILNHEDIKNHKVFESKTPSHPEIDKLAYIDASTGNIGSRYSNGTGMAFKFEILKKQIQSWKIRNI
ncbi:hypothetical protein [Mycoplasmopsis cynos]|uniref:hypothetical protein n=1 Tax=Mycoplasmopsis cynos TaxID=171284 RepID=UPI003A5C7B9D